MRLYKAKYLQSGNSIKSKCKIPRIQKGVKDTNGLGVTRTPTQSELVEEVCTHLEKIELLIFAF